MALRESVVATVVGSADIFNLEEAVRRIFQHPINEPRVCGQDRFEVHALEVAAAVGVADTLFIFVTLHVTVPRGKVNLEIVARVFALADGAVSVAAIAEALLVCGASGNLPQDDPR